jgi:hypothetical protein
MCFLNFREAVDIEKLHNKRGFAVDKLTTYITLDNSLKWKTSYLFVEKICEDEQNLCEVHSRHSIKCPYIIGITYIHIISFNTHGNSVGSRNKNY